MTTLKATVTGGRLEIDVPADWPDGTQVEIHPLGNGAADEESMSPEEVRSLLAAMDQMEPLEFTDAEQAAWEAERLARKQWEKAHFAEYAAKLKGMWE
jgi:hypothetical protein